MSVTSFARLGLKWTQIGHLRKRKIFLHLTLRDSNKRTKRMIHKQTRLRRQAYGRATRWGIILKSMRMALDHACLL